MAEDDKKKLPVDQFGLPAPSQDPQNAEIERDYELDHPAGQGEPAQEAAPAPAVAPSEAAPVAGPPLDQFGLPAPSQDPKNADIVPYDDLPEWSTRRLPPIKPRPGSPSVEGELGTTRELGPRLPPSSIPPGFGLTPLPSDAGLPPASEDGGFPPPLAQEGQEQQQPAPEPQQPAQTPEEQAAEEEKRKKEPVELDPALVASAAPEAQQTLWQAAPFPGLQLPTEQPEGQERAPDSLQDAFAREPDVGMPADQDPRFGGPVDQALVPVLQGEAKAQADAAAAQRAEKLLQERYGDTASQWLTALEGYLSGATLMISDPLLGAAYATAQAVQGKDWDKAYEEARRDMDLRVAANPGLAFGTRLTGGVLSVAVGGPLWAGARALAGTAAVAETATSAGILARAINAARVVTTPVSKAISVAGIPSRIVAGQGVRISRALGVGAKGGILDTAAGISAAGSAEGAISGLVSGLNEATRPGATVEKVAEAVVSQVGTGFFIGGTVGFGAGLIGGVAGRIRGKSQAALDLATERPIEIPQSKDKLPRIEHTPVDKERMRDLGEAWGKTIATPEEAELLVRTPEDLKAAYEADPRGAFEQTIENVRLAKGGHQRIVDEQIRAAYKDGNDALKLAYEIEQDLNVTAKGEAFAFDEGDSGPLFMSRGEKDEIRDALEGKLDFFGPQRPPPEPPPIPARDPREIDLPEGPRLELDESGAPIAEQEPQGRMIDLPLITRDAQGRGVKAPKLELDESGKPLPEQELGGRMLDLERDASGRYYPGVRQRPQLDESGRPLPEQEPGGRMIDLERDETGRYRPGSRKALELDESGQPIAEQTPEGPNMMELGRDRQGRILPGGARHVEFELGEPTTAERVPASGAAETASTTGGGRTVDLDEALELGAAQRHAQERTQAGGGDTPGASQAAQAAEVRATKTGRDARTAREKARGTEADPKKKTWKPPKTVIRDMFPASRAADAAFSAELTAYRQELSAFQQHFGREVLLHEGSLMPIIDVETQLNLVQTKIRENLVKGKVGAAYMLFDQDVKGYIADVAEKATQYPRAQTVLEGLRSRSMHFLEGTVPSPDGNGFLPSIWRSGFIDATDAVNRVVGRLDVLRKMPGAYENSPLARAVADQAADAIRGARRDGTFTTWQSNLYKNELRSKLSYLFKNDKLWDMTSDGAVATRAEIRDLLDNQRTWEALSLGERQVLGNKPWSRSRAAAEDAHWQSVTSLTSFGGPYRNLTQFNDKWLKTLFENLGQPGSFRDAQAMRVNMRALAANSEARMRAWGRRGVGLPDKVQKLMSLVQTIEDRMCLVEDSSFRSELGAQYLKGAPVLERSRDVIIAGVGSAFGVLPALGAAAVTRLSPKQIAQAVAEAQEGAARGTTKAALSMTKLGVKTLSKIEDAADDATRAAIYMSRLASPKDVRKKLDEARATIQPGTPHNDALLEHGAAIEKSAPDLAKAVVDLETKRAAYVVQFAPADDRYSTLEERRMQARMTASYWPEKTLTRMGEGVATTDEVTAFKELYPELYKQFQETVSQLVSEKPPKTRKEQDIIFKMAGIATRPSLEAEQILKAQAGAARAAGETGVDPMKLDQKQQQDGVRMNMDPDRYSTRADELMSEP